VIVLGLETATASGAVALEIDGRLVGELVTTTEREHTESLLGGALELLESAGATFRDLDLLVVDLGPGLFTGLRVGVSTARSLAMAAGISVVGLSSLEIMAHDPSVDHAAEVVTVIDARRGEVFAQHFVRVGGELEERSDASVLHPDELVAMLERRGQATGEVTVLGDGALRYREGIEDLEGVTLLGDVHLPSPAVACALARQRRLLGLEPSLVFPVYLRDPDAVANFTTAPSGDAR
jgi:tRNA threonylcarbamoyladenosine biosynthesis protein TsaB